MRLSRPISSRGYFTKEGNRRIKEDNRLQKRIPREGYFVNRES